MPFPTTNPALERALAGRAYLEPTSVQSAVLADEAAGRDLLVSAQTGSGKTVAFGLAMAATLLGDSERFERAGEPLALIIAPTRELAVQVHTELSWLYADAGARVISCVGGMDARAEQRLLANGCHIVVGTPGRLRDHLERGRLDISSLKVVVLDEADEMLDLGFREDLEFILDATPKSRRTLLFSATIAREIANLARDYQQDALRIDTQVRNQAHGDIEYRAVRVAPTDVDHAIVNLLRFYEARAALIFCHTREAVRHLHASLSERGFSTVALSGELSQSERTHALQALRDCRARVCVATDVAARGLDLPDLSLVIHADLPREKATLLHRSGRTGRAGRKGICALIVPFPRRRHLERLLTEANIKAIWQDPPKAEEIRARDQERMLEDPAIKEPATPEDIVLAQALLAGRPAEEIAAALIRFYRSRLPAPEDMFDSGPADMRQERYEERGERKRRDDGARGGDRGGSDRSEGGPVSWFRLDVGRENNADPKWLIPLICRRGHITKREIGFIKIFDKETKFEIAADAADRFLSAVEKSGDQEISIKPTTPFNKDAGRSNADRLTRDNPPSERLPRKFDAPADGARSDRPRTERPRDGERRPFAAKRTEGYARPRDDKAPFKKEGRSFEGKRSNNPKFDKPKFEGPRSEGFKSDRPKFDKPKFDKPKFDGPKFDPAGKAKKKHRKGPSRP
ncbi:MAG: DEAD/DEAH box helicase [Rhodospirillaceae bacterium]|nr:DEAD/DEAH box helicase [Rhodospirillaceae bacterium]